MKYNMKQRVYYGDTDSYGVVWHGAYVRWMEQARVEFCREIGLDLVELMNNGITIPVTNMNIRYKASARLDEPIVVETYVSKISPLTITFTQIIKSEDLTRTFIIGTVEVVAVNNEGKIYRRLPDVLKQACEQVLEV